MMTLVSSSFALFLALVFLRAFMHKAMDFTQFQGFVSDYRIMPDKLTFPLAVAIVATELGAISLSLFPQTRTLGMLIIITLLVVYAAVIAINLQRGHRHIECGCGGIPQRLDTSLLWRNAVLAVMALVPLTSPALPLTAAAVVATIMASLLLLFAFMLFENINAIRLHRNDTLHSQI
tara:strand:- start:896 stop:1426 length:531 start_codon:yes stop_codon:yes gene_type:complete